MSDLLFAYGFLKQKFHGSLATRTPKMDVTFVAEGRYQGHLYKVDHYPGVIFDGTAPFAILGEVLRMNDPETLLPVLDRYEHSLPLITEDPEYERVLRPVETDQGVLQCWVYEYLGSVRKEQKIDSGKF